MSLENKIAMLSLAVDIATLLVTIYSINKK